MNRNDTLRAISVLARGSHGATLFALGYLTLHTTQEVLDDLLTALQEWTPGNELLNHIEQARALTDERYGRRS
jgi:hypothetical protein